MMDLKRKLLDLAREATGDPDITVAGDFQPKGMTWKLAAGAAAGGVIGDVSGAGTGLGATGGLIAGRYAASSGQLPPVVVLAASATRLYVLTSTNAKGSNLAKQMVVLDTLERADITVELKQRATSRTAVITDESTGHEYQLEGKRLLFHHMNDLLDALGPGADANGDTTTRTSRRQGGASRPPGNGLMT